MEKLLIIGGATGSGKSAVAVECALRLDGEVVSADSMQIYKGLNVGTAKITENEAKGVLHHMIDVVSPKESFSVCDYKKAAVAIVRDVLSRGKTPIVCGGTGLYIHSLIYDMSYSGEYDETLRASLKDELEKIGKEKMFEKLRSLDPDAANKLHVNDEKRVLRAIEKALTGGTKENDFEKPLFDYKLYLIKRPREILYNRINERVDEMMRSGLKKEVEDLLAAGVSFSDRSMQAIAYKEWALKKEGLSDEEIFELIKRRTRNYAKRQDTWFKQYKTAIEVQAEGKTPSEIADFIVRDFKGEDND